MIVIEGQPAIPPQPKVTKRPKSPFEGFAIAASFWLWGVLAIYSTSYVDAATWWHPLAYGVGIACLAVGLMGTMVELSRLAHGEAWAWWGVGMVFLVPAVALGVAVEANSFPHVAETVVKVIILVLAFMTAPFLLTGVVHFLSPSQAEAMKDETREAHRVNPELAASLVIAILSITAAALRFALEFAE